MINVKINSGSGTSTLINAPAHSGSFTINDQTPFNYVGAVNQELQNLTSELTQGYYMAIISYSYLNRRGFMVRAGLAHTYSQSSIMKFETDDGGFTWSNSVVHTETNVDSRNYGGGNTSKGVIVVFYARQGSSSWLSMRAMRSVDGGNTWVHTADLPMYGTPVAFSPHGRMIELEDGTLIQAFYGVDPDTVWTLKSIDDGVTWGTPVLIVSGTDMNEVDLAYLGNGKIICAVREGAVSAPNDVFIYNSDDSGATWSSMGEGMLAQSIKAPGTAPLLITKDSNSAYFIQFQRTSGINQMYETTLDYGTNTMLGLLRRFNPGNSSRPASNNNFGYGRELNFDGTTDKMLVAWNDLSEEWVSGSTFTDIWVGPIFRKKVVESRKTSGTYAPGSNIYTPSFYQSDEFPSYNNDANTYQHIIRESGSYTVDVIAVFTGNTTGTFRRLTVELWNSTTDTYTSDLQEIQQTNNQNSFSFSFSTTRNFPDALVLNIEHDATGSLTVSSIIFKITKS